MMMMTALCKQSRLLDRLNRWIILSLLCGILFFNYCCVYAEITSNDLHFITSLCLRYDSINEVRILNKLLKSRKVWGDSFQDVNCTIIAFRDIPSDNLVGNFYFRLEDQFQYMASQQSGCAVLFSDESCPTLEVGSLKALKLAVEYLELKSDYLFYINSNSMILTNPLHFINRELKEDRRMLLFSSGNEVSELNTCQIVSLLMPVRGIQLANEFSSLCSFLFALNNLSEEEKTTLPFTIQNLPLELRYLLTKDPALHMKVSEISILSMSSGAEWDISLVETNSPDDSQYPAINGKYYTCYEFIKYNDANQGKKYFGADFLQRKLSSFTRRQLCESFFGDFLLENVPSTQIGLDGSLVDNFQVPIWMRLVPPITSITADDRGSSLSLPVEGNKEIFPEFSIPHPLNEEYHQLLQASRPTVRFFRSINDTIQELIVPNDVTLKSFSKCSILYFADGFDYLLQAYESARRVWSFQSYLSWDICESFFPNVFLYTSNWLTEEIWEEYRQGRQEIPSFWMFISAFTTVYQTSTDPFFLNFIPSKDDILQALHQSGQDGFQHHPLIYWRRMSILFHLPTEYNLIMDTDVVPCLKGYDSLWRDLLEKDIVSFVDISARYGGTNAEERFPFPGIYPTSEWMSFPERIVAFLMLKRNTIVQELVWRYALAYRKELKMIQQGRTYIRGEQPAFREALYSLRHEMNEQVMTIRNHTFCFRPYSYHPACKLYHGTDRYEKCS